jgi:hypothetical protein
MHPADARQRRTTMGKNSLATAVATAAAFFQLTASNVGAGASCFTIEDPDQRALCRALETKSVGNCTAISDYALRQTCRARLASQPSHCNTITSQWERKKCLDEAERKAKP